MQEVPETRKPGEKGQTEAARSLGLSRWQSMRLVVLPQAIKNVLPALANEVVTMVKESSICSVLGMAEMMFAAKTIAGSTGISLAPYTMAALVYFWDSVVKSTLKDKAAKFAPYLMTVFFFIFFMNLLGLVVVFPGGANLTGNISAWMEGSNSSAFSVSPATLAVG